LDESCRRALRGIDETAARRTPPEVRDRDLDAAFGAIYRDCYHVMVQAARVLGKGSHVAEEDLVQDAFVVFYRAMKDALRRRELAATSPLAFLHRVAYRRGVDSLRRRKFVAEVGASDTSRPAPEPAAQPEYDSSLDAQRVMHRLLAAFRAEDVFIFVATQVDGMDSEEVAGMLHLGRAAVRKRLQRMRDRFPELALGPGAVSQNPGAARF
jgi:RNA polymerase sigma factor (sigma-70 family)